MTDRVPCDSFQPAVESWTAGLTNLRNVVRQELVHEQLAALTAGCSPLRVLDVGCGQGTQALLLARAGHQVIGIDLSADVLTEFSHALDAEQAEVRDRVQLVEGPGERAPELVSGPFDLILCHGVLMYLEDPEPMLNALTEVAGRHGLLSLVVRNGLAPAMRDGLLGHWETALRAFDSLDYVDRLGLPARALEPRIIDAQLGSWGWIRVEWYGVRVFTDHRPDEPLGDEDLATLLRVESEAAHRDPYRSVAALLHLIYRR